MSLSENTRKTAKKSTTLFFLYNIYLAMGRGPRPSSYVREFVTIARRNPDFFHVITDENNLTTIEWPADDIQFAQILAKTPTTTLRTVVLASVSRSLNKFGYSVRSVYRGNVQYKVATANSKKVCVPRTRKPTKSARKRSSKCSTPSQSATTARQQCLLRTKMPPTLHFPVEEHVMGDSPIVVFPWVDDF